MDAEQQQQQGSLALRGVSATSSTVLAATKHMLAHQQQQDVTALAADDQQQPLPNQQALYQQLQEPEQLVHQHLQQQQQLSPSIPLPRRRVHKAWDIAIDHWGVLESLPQPQQVSPQIQQLLMLVLENACLGSSTSDDGGGSSSSSSPERQWTQKDVELLLSTRGADMQAVVAAADQLRQVVCGDGVSYVVNRNINYTNVCTYSCRFCAFSKVRQWSWGSRFRIVCICWFCRVKQQA